MNSALCSLRYARIAGTSTSGPVQFNTGAYETALIGLAGLAFVVVADEVYEVGRYDALYVPRASGVQVHADSPGYDLAEVAAPCTGDYPVQFISYSEASVDPVLHHGSHTMLVGPNVRTERIRAGIGFSDPAGWAGFLDNGTDRVCLFLDGFPPAAVPGGPTNPAPVLPGDCLLVPAGVPLPFPFPPPPVRCIWVTAVSQELGPER